MTLFAVWLGMQVQRARQREEAIAAVQRLGGEIAYEHQRRQRGGSPSKAPPPVAEPPGPRWLRSSIGDAYFVRVTRVRLPMGNATDADLAQLKTLDEIESLSIDSTHVTDAGLKHLRGLTNLRTLDLTNTRVTDAGLVHLKRMGKLESLTLPQRIRGPGLRHLHGLENLKHLKLHTSWVSDEGLKHLPPLAGLQSLDLSLTNVADAGLEHLGPLTGLKEINLRNTAITDQGVLHLARLPSLKQVELRDTRVTVLGAQKLVKALPGVVVLPAALGSTVETKAYDVTDLIADFKGRVLGLDDDAIGGILIKFLRLHVRPHGVDAEIAESDTGKILIVTQTPRAHQQTAGVLDLFRRRMDENLIGIEEQ